MADKVNVSFDLTMGQQRVRVSVNVPDGPIPARRLLPFFQGLSHQVIDAAVRESTARGETVSCKAGCGACCRQLVPVSEIEARQLRALVDAMPEPRRTAVRARFEEARSRLDAAGLLTLLEDPDARAGIDGRELNRRYMTLGIPCPFLEDESCSIHANRPVTCREYLVTSPAEHCASPSPESVRTVPMRAHVSRALVEIETHDDRSNWIPLVLAPGWAEQRQNDPVVLRPAAEWIDGVVRRMTGSTLDESAGDGSVKPEGGPDPGT